MKFLGRDKNFLWSKLVRGPVSGVEQYEAS